MSEGRPSEALQYFEKARKVAQHQKRKFDEADTLVQIGQVKNFNNAPYKRLEMAPLGKGGEMVGAKFFCTVRLKIIYS